jgi:hypothetical protein
MSFQPWANSGRPPKMRYAFAAMVALLGSFAPARAGQITYVLTSFGGSGVFDGKEFTNATVVATFTGNTSNLTSVSSGGSSYPGIPVSGTVSVQGAGTDTIAALPLYLVNLASPALSTPTVAAFDDAADGGCAPGSDLCSSIGVFTTGSTSLAGYNLTGPVGPIPGSGNLGPACLSDTIGYGCAYYMTGSGGTFYWTTSPATSTFSATPAFFTGRASVGSGAEYLQFPNSTVFGYYTVVSSPIFYHLDMGYEAFTPGSDSDAYLYDFTTGHWWYTSNTLFPYVYDFTLNAWLYYYPNPSEPGHYTSNPRDFYDFATGKVITM